MRFDSERCKCSCSQGFGAVLLLGNCAQEALLGGGGGGNDLLSGIEAVLAVAGGGAAAAAAKLGQKHSENRSSPAHEDIPGTGACPPGSGWLGAVPQTSKSEC